MLPSLLNRARTKKEASGEECKSTELKQSKRVSALYGICEAAGLYNECRESIATLTLSQHICHSSTAPPPLPVPPSLPPSILPSPSHQPPICLSQPPPLLPTTAPPQPLLSPPVSQMACSYTYYSTRTKPLCV